MTPEALCLATGCGQAAAERFAGPITQAMHEFRIREPEQQAHFLAQIAHESALFERLVENLNYSWQALMRTWPSRFPSESFAKQYHRQPEKIANYVYASRLGNGPPSSGDGWKYRGRSLIQTTGRYNYARTSNGIGVDVVSEPDRMTQPITAARASAWFWMDRECSELVGDVHALTLRINGGLHGLNERIALTRRAMSAMELA